MKVLIVGDSQAEGAPGRSLEGALRAAGHRVVRSGHSGHGAYDWTRMHWPEFRSLLASLRPDHVLMVFGSNDPANARLESAMRQFQMEAAPAKVWYAGPPRYERADVQEKGSQIRSLAKRVFGPTYLDAWPSTGPSVPRAADKLHFTAAGGRVWGDAMARDWTSALVGGGRSWVGPIVLGVGAAAGLGLFWLSRR